MTNLSIPEPNPIPNNNESVHDLLVYQLEAMCFDDLIPDILDRKQFGLNKYGTILQTDNGRNALIEAFQEALDCLIYIKQKMIESGSSKELESVFSSAYQTAVNLKFLINQKETINER